MTVCGLIIKIVNCDHLRFTQLNLQILMSMKNCIFEIDTSGRKYHAEAVRKGIDCFLCMYCFIMIPFFFRISTNTPDIPQFLFAGAIPDTVFIHELIASPVTYIPDAQRVHVKVIGALSRDTAMLDTVSPTPQGCADNDKPLWLIRPEYPEPVQYGRTTLKKIREKIKKLIYLNQNNVDHHTGEEHDNSAQQRI